MTRAAALDGGAAAALGYGAALWVLRVGAQQSLPIGWWRHVTAVGALLVVSAAVAAAADRAVPPRATRPGAELLAAAGLGGLALVLAMLSELVVTGRVDVVAVASGVLGVGLTVVGCSCRLVVEHRGRGVLRAALVVALVTVGVALAFANYVYAWTMLQGHGAEVAAHEASSVLDLGAAQLAHVIGPLAVALALPTLARALSWGLSAQVLVGMAGTAAAQRAFGLRGLDWHLEGVPIDAEVLAACLVPAACALAARWARRARPTDA